MSTKLQVIGSDRDHWRQATEKARREGEHQAEENNKLSKTCSVLRGNAEEQDRVCSLLAAELVEVIWSLTSDSAGGISVLGELQVASLCRVARQSVAQCGEGASVAEVRLALGLLGCLVNLSGRRESLLVLLGTEEGRGLVQDICSLACLPTAEPKLVQLSMMVLTNLLGTEMPYCQQAVLSSKQQEGLRAAATKWCVGERGGGRLQGVGKVSG